MSYQVDQLGVLNVSTMANSLHALQGMHAPKSWNMHFLHWLLVLLTCVWYTAFSLNVLLSYTTSLILQDLYMQDHVTQSTHFIVGANYLPLWLLTILPTCSLLACLDMLLTLEPEFQLSSITWPHSVVHVSLPSVLRFSACLHFWCDTTKGRSMLCGGDVISVFKVHSCWCQCV